MNTFDNLKYQHIKTLIDVLNRAKEKNSEHIKKRYDRVSENFDGVMDFLKKLGLLRERNGSLSISKTICLSENQQLTDHSLKWLLLNELLTTRSLLAKYVQPYLGNFKVVRSSFEYNPTTASRVR